MLGTVRIIMLQYMDPYPMPGLVPGSCNGTHIKLTKYLITKIAYEMKQTPSEEPLMRQWQITSRDTRRDSISFASAYTFLS